MNILILHSSSDLYGASNILLIIIKNLLKKGHKPIVVLSEHGPLADELGKLHIEVSIIKLGILRRKYFSVPGLINRVKVMLRAQKMLAEIVRSKRINVIYSNTTGVIAGALVAHKMKIRHIWHVHEIIEKPYIFVRILAYLLNHYSHKVIVVSDAVKQCWHKHVESTKLVRIYNGIDTWPFENENGRIHAELSIPVDSILIGMIGRVHYWKGQNYFVKIAGELSKRYSNLYFIMTGDAFPGYEYLYQEISNAIDTEGIKKNTFTLGFRKDVAAILNSLDIFILPSVSPDPFPTVLLEAMSASVPVVATSHGGATEMIIDQATGILIPVNDYIQAADKISVLIEDKELRKAMGLKGKNRITQHFSLQAFDHAIADIFK